MIGRHTRPIIIWLLGLALALTTPVASRVSAAQTLPDQAAVATVSAVGGTVSVQPSATRIEQPLGGDTQSVAPGDIVGVSDDGEAGLSAGDAVSVRVFHASHVQIGGTLPDDATALADAPSFQALAPAGALYQLNNGATYNTISVDPDNGSPVTISTPGARVVSQSGTFLLYYDPASTRSWLVVTDGTATVSAAGSSIDVPAAFFTVIADGGVPSQPQPANRASVGPDLPAIDIVSNGALADADVLAAPLPVAADVPQPAPDTASTAPALGGLVPFPTAATLRAGQTTVWYWPQRQGNLDTVSQNDTRSVVDGDAVNVSDDGRAELTFQDFNVQIYRRSVLQMIPSTDPSGYGLGYDLLQGTTLNTVSGSALQQLSNDRIGVRAGWAVVTAVYTAHPTGYPGLPFADDDYVMAQATPPADTQFSVSFDGSSSWVVVTQGTVQVAPVPPATSTGQPTPPPGAPVLVNAGFQTWVPQAQAPVTPVPATRAATGNQFPTFDELTGGELSDATVLGGPTVAPLPATMPASGAPSNTAPTGTSNLAPTANGGAAAAMPSVSRLAAPANAVTGQPLAVGAGMHNDFFSVALDAGAPSPGGLRIAMTSSDATKVTVPASVTIPAGKTAATFRVTGLVSTQDAPVVITASAPNQSSATLTVGVDAIVLGIPDSEEPTTTAASDVPAYAFAFALDRTGKLGTTEHSVLNSPLTLSWSVVDPSNNGAPSSIVTVTPTQVTIPAGEYSGQVHINRPTGTGTYQLRVSAPGLAAYTGKTVTVTR